MRIPYVPNPPTDLSEEDAQVLARVQARRGAKGLLPLDLALLHAPKVADGWNSHLGAIRTRSSLDPAIREIAMCRPALINGAWFEWRSHFPLLQQSPSFQEKPAKAEVVKQLHPKSQGELSDAEWTVLRYADAMTRNVRVPQELFDELKTKCGFEEQQIVEVTATIATYNMVSRFLVALDVDEANDSPPDDIQL